jgi:hypothetical protein
MGLPGSLIEYFLWTTICRCEGEGGMDYNTTLYYEMGFAWGVLGRVSGGRFRYPK